MTLEEQVARRRAVAHRLAVGHLMDDLRHAGLDLAWLWGETPVLSDGKLTPPPTLAARHPYLAGRVAELLGPGGEKTVSAETKHQGAGAAGCPKFGTTGKVEKHCCQLWQE